MTARVTLEEYRQLSLFKGKRQKGVRPKAAPEFHIHCMVADDLTRFCAPGWRFTHFPAGELRSPKTAGKLQRMGTKPGWPDIILLSPEGAFHGLEIKAAKGRLTDAQEDFQNWCFEHGVVYAVANSYDTALKILVAWGVIETSHGCPS